MFNNRRWTEEVHTVIGLAPVANAFAGTVSSQAVNMALWDKATFDYIKGVGATGTATLTVEVCTDAAGSNPTAIPFTYRSYATASSDVPTITPTLATSAGFTTTAGSAQVYVIEVDSQNMTAATGSYIRLKSVEVAASAVLGGIMIHLANPTYQGAAAPATVIA
jgi:hypothetical protein